MLMSIKGAETGVCWLFMFLFLYEWFIILLAGAFINLRILLCNYCRIRVAAAAAASSVARAPSNRRLTGPKPSVSFYAIPFYANWLCVSFRAD